MASAPRYSWISVKVGLVTSSSEAAWKASAMPLTSVVLPAPRSPRSTTIFGGASIAASVRPRAIVSSGDWVMNSRVSMRDLETSIARVQHCFGEGVRSEGLHISLALFLWCDPLAGTESQEVPVHTCVQGVAQGE